MAAFLERSVLVSANSDSLPLQYIILTPYVTTVMYEHQREQTKAVRCSNAQ